MEEKQTGQIEAFNDDVFAVTAALVGKVPALPATPADRRGRHGRIFKIMPGQGQGVTSPTIGSGADKVVWASRKR